MTTLALAALGAARLVEPEEAAKLGPGLIAFTIVILLVIATFLLIRSMLYHIKKVPPTFDDPDVSGPGDAASSEPDRGDDPRP